MQRPDVITLVWMAMGTVLIALTFVFVIVFTVTRPEDAAGYAWNLVGPIVGSAVILGGVILLVRDPRR